MSDFDSTLIELENLLKDVPANDPETHAALDVPGALEDLAEELEDMGLWKERQGIVEADVMRFVDNPSYPNALERMNMLNTLNGNTRWYDKWVSQRAEDAADGGEYEDVIKATNVEMQDMSVKAVDEAFEKIAQLPPEEATTTLKTVAQRVEYNFGLSEANIQEYNENAGVDDMVSGNLDTNLMEMQEVNLDAVEMPYYSIDEGGAVIAGSSIDSSMIVENVGWDLMPTLGDLGTIAAEGALGILGGAAAYGLITGFTPIIGHLIDTSWLKPGGMTQERASDIEDAVSRIRGPFYKLVDQIQKFYKDNPTYMWVFDDLTARLPDPPNYYYGHGYEFGYTKISPATNLWVRGRILMNEGPRFGFTDMTESMFLLCPSTGTVDYRTALGQKGNVWFNSHTARTMVDNAKTASLLTSTIFRDLSKYPFDQPLEVDEALGIMDQESQQVADTDDFFKENNWQNSTDGWGNDAWQGASWVQNDDFDSSTALFFSPGDLVLYKLETVKVEEKAGQVDSTGPLTSLITDAFDREVVQIMNGDVIRILTEAEYLTYTKEGEEETAPVEVRIFH
mgnify:CR=1 FL=1